MLRGSEYILLTYLNKFTQHYLGTSIGFVLVYTPNLMMPSDLYVGRQILPLLSILIGPTSGSSTIMSPYTSKLIRNQVLNYISTN